MANRYVLDTNYPKSLIYIRFSFHRPLTASKEKWPALVAYGRCYVVYIRRSMKRMEGSVRVAGQLVANRPANQAPNVWGWSTR